MLLACIGPDDHVKRERSRTPTPLSACTGLEFSPCNVAGRGCQRRLSAIASCAFGGPKEAVLDPNVRFIDVDDYRKELEGRGSSTSEYQPIWDRYEEVLVALELTTPGAFSPAETTEFAVNNFVAYYSISDKNITMIGSPEERGELTTSIIFVHEMIHALQDLEHGLTELNSRPFTYDQSLHTGALIEGEARFHEVRVLAAMQGLDEERLDLDMSLRATRTAGEARLFEQDELYFSSSVAVRYEYGTEYVSSLWQRGGPQGVRDRFEATPLSTYYTLAEVWERWDDDAPLEVAYPMVYPETEHGVPVYWASHGPWALYALARHHQLGVPLAQDLR